MGNPAGGAALACLLGYGGLLAHDVRVYCALERISTDTFRLNRLCLLQVVDAHKRGIPHLYVVPCLLLTFMFGPTGLLAYFLARAVTRSKRKLF